MATEFEINHNACGSKNVIDYRTDQIAIIGGIPLSDLNEEDAYLWIELLNSMKKQLPAPKNVLAGRRK